MPHEKYVNVYWLKSISWLVSLFLRFKSCKLTYFVWFFKGVTFKNGRVGVNFGGYEAEAGLGGLLTGNAADGGLGASAKTPFGQAAGAGLGGRVDGM